MNREDITRMAREAGFVGFDGDNRPLRRFAALVAAAERNKLAQWMMARGYATGHGETVEDLLQELEWQIAENWTRGMVNGVQAEREAILQMSAATWFKTQADYDAAIRARGKDPMPLFDDWGKDWK